MIVGITLIVIELFAAGLSGGGVNPARSLCAAIVRQEFQHYEWIYFVGYLIKSYLTANTRPFLGSVFAALVYSLVQFVEYDSERVKVEKEWNKRNSSQMSSTASDVVTDNSFTTASKSHSSRDIGGLNTEGLRSQRKEYTITRV